MMQRRRTIMGKKVLLLSLCMLVAMFLPGCGETMENHSALSMQEDGSWEERYNTNVIMDGGGVYAKVSVNVKKDIDEKDMLKILDYYRLILVEGSGFDVEDEEAAVYGVFYKGNTDEEIRRFKYVDRESVDIPEEEQSYFPTPELRNGYDEIE